VPSDGLAPTFGKWSEARSDRSKQRIENTLLSLFKNDRRTDRGVVNAKGHMRVLMRQLMLEYLCKYVLEGDAPSF
jgi:hypothetical protein